MEFNMNFEGGVELPKEIKDNLCGALHAFAMFLHEKTNSQEVIIDIRHSSDAVHKQSMTAMGAVGLERKQKPSQENVDAAQAAQEAIDRALAQAKKKGQEGP